MNWTYFRRGECPVCNGARKDCRQNDLTNLIHCRDAEANPPDYVFRGQDAWGFGMWAFKADVEEWSEERLQEWQQEQALRKKQGIKAQKERQAKALTSKQRDKVIRSILGQLTLSDNHRENLCRRGLTDEQIKAGHFRSVKKWQKLDNPVNDNLAGVKKGGYSLLIPEEGILCPIPDHNGLLVGWQLRKDKSDEGGKYIWASGDKTLNPKPSSHLPNGELPIACYIPQENGKLPLNYFSSQENRELRLSYCIPQENNELTLNCDSLPPNRELTLNCYIPQDNSELPIAGDKEDRRQVANNPTINGKIVGLTEGTSIKPYIASLHLNIPILGAAGGNFASSPETFKESLEALEASVIRLYSDGGAILNPNVLNQYLKTFDLLKSWNYQVEVAWWGQIEKSNGDIDEISLETINRIQYLTPNQFIEIAQKHGFEPSNYGKFFQNRADLSIDEEPDTEIYEAHIRELEARERVEEEIAEELLKQEEIERRRIRVREVGQKQIPLNTITRQPDLSFNEKSFNLSILQNILLEGLLMLNAYKSWGKSRFKKELIKQWQQKGKPVISIVPRILLGKEQAVKWSIRWINKDGITKIEDYETISLCFDSLGKLYDKDWSEALVIFDEVRQGLKHLISSSTLEDKRPFILRLLEEKLPEVIKTGGLVIGGDADLTEIEVNYLEKLSQHKAFVINNDYIPTKGTIILNTGKYDETLDEIANRYRQGENLFIFCETKADSKAIYDRLVKIKRSHRPWLINGDSTEEKEVKAIIEGNINRAIKEQKPSALICTTSMSTGVSIDGWIDGVFYEEVYHHFDYGFAIAHGIVLEPVDVTQGMIRVRKNLDFTVYTGEGKVRDDNFNSCDPDVIKRQIIKNTNYTDTLLKVTTEQLEETLGREPSHLEVVEAFRAKINPKTEMIDDPHLDLYAQVKARANYAKQNFDLCLRQQLIDEGYPVFDYYCESSTCIGDIHRQQKEIDQHEEAIAIANADDITLEEASDIVRRNATLPERHQATKAFLKAELPEVELTPEFIHKAIIKDRRRWLNSHKLFWLIQHPEIAKEIDTGTYLRKIKQFTHGVIFLPDIKAYSPIINEFNQIGLFDIIDLENPHSEITKDDPNLKNLMEKAYFRRHKIYTALNLTVTRKTDPIQFLQRLLRKVGLDLKISRTERVDGKKIRYYSLNTSLLEEGDRVAVLEALNRRFLKEDSQHDQNIKTQTQQKIETGQHSSVGFIKIASAVLSDNDIETLTLIVEYAEFKNDLDYALSVLWRAVNQDEELYNHYWIRAYNALSHEAKSRVNDWLSSA